MLDYKKQTKKIECLVLIFVFMISCQCTTYIFSRSLQCVDQNISKSCQQWNQIGYLIQDWNWFNCFPAETLLLGENGPIQMKDLKIGDMIFSFNPKSQRQQFTKVIGWFHRDQTSLFEYNQIRTQGNMSFFSSQFHNIGYQNEGRISFKFLNQLNWNDSLILNDGQTLRIQTKDEKKELEGLYSPITQNGLYYIYPNNLEINQQKQKMILVHSLSQIKNPLQNFDFTLALFHILSFFDFESLQFYQNQQYIHPIMKHFTFLYGQDWIEHKSKIKHLSTGSSSNNRYRNMIRRISMIRGLQMQMLDTILT